MFKLCDKFTSNKIKLWEIYLCIYSNDLEDALTFSYSKGDIIK